MKQPFFSIVIPTLDEEKFLPNLLLDLTNQSFTDFEVIHVDGNSDDKTVAEAKRFDKKLDLKHISTDIRSASHQRNLGAEKAKGEWIVFVDADTRIDQHFFLVLRYRIAMSERIRNPKNPEPPKTRFDVFSCIIALGREDKKKTKYQLNARTINASMRSSAGSDTPVVLGAMLGVRSSWFGAVRFDVKAKFAEDRFFLRDLIAAGAKYKLLAKPTYYYSMRRFRNENIVKTAAKTTLREFKLEFGDEYDEFDYEMYGGRDRT